MGSNVMYYCVGKRVSMRSYNEIIENVWCQLKGSCGLQRLYRVSRYVAQTKWRYDGLIFGEVVCQVFNTRSLVYVKKYPEESESIPI